MTDLQFLAKLRWRLEGDPEEMICTLGVTDAVDEPRDPVQVAEMVWGAWTGAWEANTLMVGYSFVGVDIVQGDATGGAEGAHVSWDETQTGSATNGAPPNNCTLLVQKKTAKGGKRQHGRMYLPAGYLGKADVSQTGVIAGAVRQSMQDRMDMFYGNLTDDQLAPAPDFPRLRPLLFHSPGSTGGDLSATEIIKFVVDGRIATQRRRLRP